MISRNVILTEEALREQVKFFLERDAFAFDVETIGKYRGVPSQNDVVWIALATYGRVIVIPMGHPNGDVLLQKATRKKNRETNKFDMFDPVYDEPVKQLDPATVFEILRPLFFSDSIVKIAHNATFDFISIAKYYGGEIPSGPMCDTIVLQHLLDENLISKKLKDLTEKYYKVKYDYENVGKKIELHPFWKVAHYAYMDVKYTWLLYLFLNDLIDVEDEDGHDLSRITSLELELLPTLCDMGLTGAPVDEAAIRTLEKELVVEVDRLLGKTYEVAGKKFNMNSPAQKANILFGPKSEGNQGLRPKVLTDGGKKKDEKGLQLLPADYTTKADVLEEYYPNNPVVKAIVEYQQVNKILTTYVQGYLGVEGDKEKPCRIFDSRVHTDLVQYGTVTGRFSSRDPNLQNIPRPDTELGKKIRGLFLAPPGYKLVVADYGQIEMVILAHFAGPGRLYNGIHNGMDPHSATAAALAGIDPDEFMRMVADGDPVAKAMRQVAKGINFAVVYGAGPEKVASMAGITVKEAEKFLEMHKRLFPEIYRFKEKVLKVCKSRRPAHIRTLMGRKRRLPQIFSKDFGKRGYAERQAVNSLIQGSAADIIKLAMIVLHEMLPDDMKLILSVHDELVVLAPEEKADECAELVREAMLGEHISSLINVPLSSDLKICQRWSEAK